MLLHNAELISLAIILILLLLLLECCFDFILFIILVLCCLAPVVILLSAHLAQRELLVGLCLLHLESLFGIILVLVILAGISI